VSFLTIDDGVFKVRAISGDAHLGGEDFDNRLVPYVGEQFRRRHKKDLWTTYVPSAESALLASVPSVLSPSQNRPPSGLTLAVTISTSILPATNLKGSVRTSSSK